MSSQAYQYIELCFGSLCLLYPGLGGFPVVLETSQLTHGESTFFEAPDSLTGKGWKWTD